MIEASFSLKAVICYQNIQNLFSLIAPYFDVKVVADVTFGGEVAVSIPITIGNIPHKKAFQTFDSKDGELHHLPSDWATKYPNIPGYTGEKYISYKSV